MCRPAAVTVVIQPVWLIPLPQSDPDQTLVLCCVCVQASCCYSGYPASLTHPSTSRWSWPNTSSLLCLCAGQLLLQWLSSQFDSSHYLSLILTKHDIAVLMSQFCTHLLAAGVLSQLEGQTTLREPAFKVTFLFFVVQLVLHSVRGGIQALKESL